MKYEYSEYLFLQIHRLKGSFYGFDKIDPYKRYAFPPKNFEFLKLILDSYDASKNNTNVTSDIFEFLMYILQKIGSLFIVPDEVDEKFEEFYARRLRQIAKDGVFCNLSPN